MTTDLYVENGVGRAVKDAINLFTDRHRVTAHWQHDIHPNMQERQAKGDSWWIEDITKQGMAILTQDCAILRDPAERATVVQSGAKIIALGRADYNVWEKLHCIVVHWPDVDWLLRARGPSALVLSKTSATRETLTS